jgi:hypothetical protein
MEFGGKVRNKKDEITDAWNVLYKELLHDLYFLPNCTGW